MEPSPLTQQARPQVFQQKVVALYEELFKDEEDHEKSEGYWREFFLLKPDKATLQKIIFELSPDDLLHLQAQTRQLFSRAVGCIKAGRAPADAHALDTATAFLASVLPKKYTNPSSDIINVIAGLDQVDAVFTDFVAALDVTIRTGRTLDIREKAIEVALSVVSGAYQTSLLSYFTHRDLFPSLMKFIQDSDTTSRAFEPFMLLGLLANYNKFEFQNPYRLRLDDFVNEGTIQKIIRSVGQTCSISRGKYVAIQEDLPEGWSISTTLNMIGLGGIAPGAKTATPVLDPEVAKEKFAQLPGSEAAVLLATYDFAHANKLFCFNFVSLPAEKGLEAPISSFLSLTSYLLQHAHLSARATLYSHLNLLILRLLIEDQILCKRICSDEGKVTVRLCRQRSPYLPIVRGDRVYASSMLDTMIDGINHNLRRRLDVELYILCVGTILRVISHLSRSRTRLNYHWPELFRSLLSLVRFLNTYAADLKSLSHIDVLLDDLVNLIALSLSAGEAFLPNPTTYDDLFYKLVEMGEVLVKFRENYDLGKRPTNSIDTLISVSEHYNQLLEDGASGRRGKHLTSAQVAGVIKQGYETLSIQAKEGLDSWDKYREADKRVFLKKMARAAVADVKRLISEA
ncbi:DUF1741 domain containing protein [Hyaloscypha variabilis]|uniref:DUF1741-domain-containing protein n=1 Tax=Hyaloscypha variabilis (strain UAMH 11265 / GT02V1 / F) TaxID=1149755 RepID=A0A2J6S3B9_HYAVF|nr:DUF1741-domain-containing protein [Hyaloscypha variabilis F]